MSNNEFPITTISEMLKRLEEQEFFGGVELKFERGRLVTIRKTETLKPHDLSRYGGKYSGQGQR